MKATQKLLTFCLLVISLSSFGQITINNGFTAQQLGNNLAGNNVNVTNASISGDPNQFGTFSYIGTDLGLNSGVILSTGDIFDAVGPNSSGNTSSNMGGPGDADLSALAGFNTNDAVVFEFEFEVQGDEIEFNFVFMSEEYNEFVNSSFNDVFAFYISGPGIAGMENLAVVPGTTTPVTINTINNGSFWQFYNDNTNGNVNVEFDGFTTVMTAAKNGLTPCGVYTLSLRIADGSDSAYDSAVLLEENSLVQSNISATSSTFSANNTALEGCIEASFTFQLDSVLTQDVNIPIGIGGTATNGVDYSQIDTLITIPAGQLSATVIIDAIADGIPEGQEVVELYFSPSPCEPQDTVFLYIDDYTPLEYNVDPTNVSCWGAMNGEVDLSVTGGIPPYTLTLTDSLTGDVTTYTNFPVQGLDVGTYYVEVIDGYGCTAEDIIAGNLFDAGQTFIPDGQGQSWSSVINISGFGAGAVVQTADQIQSVCATMEHSKIGELEITLTSPSGTVVTLKEQPGGNNTNFGEPCAVGPTDAGAGAGDTLPGIGYNYCWQPVATYGTMVDEAGNFTYTYINVCDGSTQSDKYLPAGSYQPYEPFANFIGDQLNGPWTITITDHIPNNNGYIFDWSISLQADPPDSVFTITQPDPPLISDAVIQPDCGLSNGSIDLTVTDGAPPFTFLWNTGATTEDISGLSAGTYTVDITDDSSCVFTYQVDLSNNGSLVLAGNVTDEICAGGNDGAIDLTVTGAGPFTYSWSSGQTTEDISNLAPGNYTVTVQDGGGCIGTMTFTVNPAANINIEAVITNENCGDQEGIINITVYGATNPTTFLWSNGDTTEDINELVQGTYSVELWDNNNCYATDTFTIINLVGNCVPNCDLEITNAAVLDETCGNTNGSIDLTTFTTNGPILVSWNNGATTEDINTLSAGTYEVTLTDQEGCEVIQSYSIINNTGTLAITNINTTNEYCGNGQGGADATVTGGALPYTFNWSNGATTEDLTGVAAGTYTLTVTDANGCSANQTITIINDAGTLEQIYGNAVDEVCSNSNGSIDIVIQGGQPPYSYQWSNGATTEDLINIPAGSYTCTITDNGGCSITTPTYVVNNQSGTLAFDNIDIDNEICSNVLGSIELFVSGGSGPLSFLWNTGATTQDLFNLSAGTYSATVSDTNGCSLSTGNLIVLNESGTLNLDNVVVFNEICGNSTGSVNITVSGGTAPITYLWNTGSTSEDLTNLPAGNYDCVITDANGCSVVAGATVQNDPGVLNVDNIIITDENCGQSDGALNAIISGAALPATYVWSSGQTTEDISGIPAGSYTLTVTDNNGCTTNATAVVNNDAGTLSLDNAQVSNEICGASNGAIDITVSGGVGALTYSWDSGQTTEDISGISAGIYTCTITDGGGCSIVAGPYTINNSSGSLSVGLASVTDETCSNGAGAIDINVSGGTMPYTFSWSSGQTTEDLSGLSAGTYTVTVSDASGCTVTMDVDILNDAGTLEIASVLVTDEECGNTSGAIDITVAGGTPGYNYIWSNTAMTEDISGLSAGSFSVTVSDAAGCFVNSGNIVVNNTPGSLSLNAVNVTDEVCGDSTGYIDVVISGQVGTLTYLWSNGQTTEDLDSLMAGTYSGTATDVNGCMISFSAIVVNDPGNMTVSESLTNATCDGGNGAIDITVNAGVLPITYIWSNGATTEDISGLNAGAYICNITDDAGCTTNYSATIQDLGNPTIAGISVTDETCGNADGAISVNVNGGTAPYTYNWTAPAANPCCTYTLDMQDQGNSWNGASIDVFINGTLEGNYTVPGGGANVETFPVCSGDSIELVWNSGGFDNEVSFDLLDGSGTIVFSQGPSPTPGTLYNDTASCAPAPLSGPNLTGLSAGTYTVVVTDANGCSDSTDIVVNNTSGSLQLVSATITNETCTDSNGAIDITVSGTAPYTYVWNTGDATEDLTDLSAGTYYVDVTDQQGCMIADTFTLTDFNNGLTIDAFTITDESCGDGMGAIDITPTGGVGTLSFDWSTGATTEDIIALSAGTYSVTIYDGSVCDYDTTFTVGNTTGGLTASAVVTHENCGDTTGGIDLTVTGGVQPYTFLWNNSATTEDLTGISAGAYTCVITDDSGCEYTITEVVSNQMANITVNALVTDEDCSNADGAIGISVSGGTAPYSYSWSNGETTEDIANLTGGTYTLMITDANGCTYTEAFTVGTTGFNYTFTITNEDCATGNGAIDLQFFGFNQPDETNWSNGATTQDISNLTSGWYTVEIIETGFGACQQTDSFFVDVNQGTLNIDSILVTNETCTGTNGALDAFISGGSGPYTYLWSNAATTEDISGLSQGNYTLTVTDQFGCEASASAYVNNFTFGLGGAGAFITDEMCGDSTGTIDLTVAGGTMPYTYSWNTGATTEDLANLTSGTYTVTITDNNSCVVVASYTVGNVTNGFTVEALITDETCGNSNGAIDITTTGGVAPITFDWDTGATTEDISGLTGGTYSCIVTDNSGCAITISETVVSYSSNFNSGTPVVTDESCGDSTGTITLNPVDGSAPYSYNWDLPAGCCEYTLNMYDLNNNGWGGNPIPEVLVYINGALYGNFTVPTGFGNDFNSETIPICDGDTLEFEYVEAAQNQNNTYEVLDASGNVIFQDGPNPFNGIAFTTVASCNPGNVNQLTGLTSGNYPVEITDAIGCVIYDTIYVGNNTGGFEISDTLITDENCGDGNGAIDLTVAGGISPYNYSWDNGATTEDLTGLTQGVYTITLSDDAGCTLIDSFQVLNNTGGFEISGAVLIDDTCGVGMGAIDITVTGGTLPYTYSWSNGATTEDLTGLNGGSYDVTVTDNSGCTFTESYTINTLGTPVVVTDTIITNATCATCTDGAIDITVDPNGGPFTYAWDNGTTTEDISNLTPGTYTVTITNNGGCSVMETYSVKDVTLVEALNGGYIEVYPNPSQGLFEIHFADVSGDQLRISVTDAAGRLVDTENRITGTAEGSLVLDLRTYEAGMYLLHISVGDEQVFLERLVIHK